ARAALAQHGDLACVHQFAERRDIQAKGVGHDGTVDGDFASRFEGDGDAPVHGAIVVRAPGWRLDLDQVRALERCGSASKSGRMWCENVVPTKMGPGTFFTGRRTINGAQ